MGSHNSHEVKDVADAGGNGSGISTPRGGSHRGSRSGSGGDLQGLAEKQEKPPLSMATVEKLGKLLVQRSQKEEGINGVTQNSFRKYLFPMYPELATHFFVHIHRAAKCKNSYIPLSTFRQQCEKIMSLLDDAIITETYVRMFSTDQEDGTVYPDCLRKILYTSYKLAMDHYPEGPQTCLLINKTISAVVNGCFNNKESHSVGFVVRWLEEHCHRLIHPVHRYCVHTLATRHRDMETAVSHDGDGVGLELGTPVLSRSLGSGSALLPLSAAWLLAAAAHPVFSQPKQPPNYQAGGGLASAAWLSRLVCAVPSHWAPLYISRDHGLGTNRFLHHTLAYRGPTLVLLQAQELVVVICCPVEWRDTHQYWGGPECALIQLEPTFSVVERGPKMLYLNTAIRGYAKGLRAGADPRKPVLIVPEAFDTLTFKGVPYALNSIEVWGCGDTALREKQLDVKKWQAKEAERQRQVKLSAADWIEHPDRYLLELAGRPQYNHFSVVERGPKMLYLNTAIRGYAKGLRAGADPRKPVLIVPEAFDTLTFKGVPYALNSIEVWGCGDTALREKQLDVKKWQAKEAERQRQVKLSAADWIEHPDRYLLELAGRPQYNHFSVVERGPKMLYLNTAIRGYAKGLRAGADPRKPVLIVPEAFDTLTFKGVPYALNSIEVWGCDDTALREKQLDVKKWQAKEAERQRQVKLSAADWIEHPDRYLLELAGRPQYNQSAS